MHLLNKIISTYKQYPLSVRIVKYIFGFSLLTAVLASLGHLWFAYSDEINKLEGKLSRLEKEQVLLLADNLWSYNSHAIKIQLESILSDKDIVYIEIRVDDRVEYKAGQENYPNKDLNKTYSLLYQNKIIGKVTFYATKDLIKRHLFTLIFGSLAAQVIGILFTTLFIVIILILMLIRPLMRIISFTDTVQLSNLDRKFVLKRKGNGSDELDTIVAELNDMRERLNKDIKEKQQIRQDLISEQTFSDTVINSLPGIFFVLDENHKIIRHNQQFKSQTSSPDNGTDFDIYHLIDNTDHDMLRRTFNHVFSKEESVSMKVQLINPESKPVPYLLNCSILSIGEGRYLVGIGTDLTERRQIEKALVRAQKMESIGTLSSGIAHDFNNILSAIFGYAEVSMQDVPKKTELYSHLESIIKAAERARDLVRQILTIGRHSEQKDVSLQISLVVKEALKLIRSTVPASIDIQAEIESDKFIFADPTQIHQIIMNLCTNAYQAMQNTGGLMTVRLTDTSASSIQRMSQKANISPGEYILLEISDTGYGMTKDVMERIFDPYFTTKEKASGTGLGLAVVQGIIQQCGGYLTVYSEPGQGSSFKAFFPVYQGRHQSGISFKQPEMINYIGNEHIMIVDDEVNIRETAKLILQSNGYTVSEFGNGQIALEYYLKNPNKYDLILTDMTMPIMTGVDMGKIIRSTNSDIPIILWTGFNENISKDKSKSVGFSLHLQKPVESKVLLANIRMLLDRKS
jgi:signal transduction histidine kinase/CheY-like chemotaxis protein